jgi:hypothetical protein
MEARPMPASVFPTGTYIAPALAASLLWASAGVGAPIDARPLARSSTLGPSITGLPGVTIADLGSPRLDDAGNLLIIARLTGPQITPVNEQALLFIPADATTPGGTGGTALPLLRRGESPGPGFNSISGILDAHFVPGPPTPPGTPGAPADILANFAQFQPQPGFVANQTLARLSTSPSPFSGQLLATEGAPLPGAAPIPTIDGLVPAAFFDGSTIAFISARVGEGTFAGSSFRGGTFASVRTDRPGLIINTGDPLPNAPAGTTFQAFDDPVVTRAGTVAFLAFTTGGGLAAGSQALLIELNGTLFEAARTGAVAPGTNPGTTFGELSRPVASTRARTLFLARLTGGDSTPATDAALFQAAGAGSVTTLLLRKGTELAGAPGAPIAAISPTPAANFGGATAALVTLGGNASPNNNAALAFIDADGRTTMPLREGDPAPRGPAGSTIARLGQPVLLDSGTLALVADITTPSTSPSTRAAVIAGNPASRGFSTLLAVGDPATIPLPDGSAIDATIFSIALEDPAGQPRPFSQRLLATVTYRHTGTTPPVFSQAVLELTPGCAADLDGNGLLNPDDLSDFITFFFLAPPDGRADFDGNGTINGDDMMDYIVAYFAGCA